MQRLGTSNGEWWLSRTTLCLLWQSWFSAHPERPKICENKKTLSVSVPPLAGCYPWGFKTFGACKSTWLMMDPSVARSTSNLFLKDPSQQTQGASTGWKEHGDLICGCNANHDSPATIFGIHQQNATEWRKWMIKYAGIGKYLLEHVSRRNQATPCWWLRSS